MQVLRTNATFCIHFLTLAANSVPNDFFKPNSSHVDDRNLALINHRVDISNRSLIPAVALTISTANEVTLGLPTQVGCILVNK